MLSPHSVKSSLLYDTQNFEARTDDKGSTLLKIQEMRDEIREVRESLEQINSRHHSLNTNQVNDLALRNLKSNFDAISASRQATYNQEKENRNGSLQEEHRSSSSVHVAPYSAGKVQPSARSSYSR